MQERTLVKLKKKMEAGAKAIALGDKAIKAIELTQKKTINDFNKDVILAVKKSEEKIEYHQNLIREVKGMKL